MGTLIIIGSNLITLTLAVYTFRRVLLDLGAYIPVLASAKGFEVSYRLKPGPKTKLKDVARILDLTEKYGCKCPECLKAKDD